MDNDLRHVSVNELVELYRHDMLVANREYQRGQVWSDAQKKKLIDSLMRGYPLPVIYLHHIKKQISGMTSEGLEIIDGQQRIRSLYEFAEGGHRLFDPVADDKQARFPEFIKDQPCPWGGKFFQGLTEELQKRFLDTTLPVAWIESEDPNEIRDLFVRLQAGLPLNPQEKRDVQPGDFAEVVTQLGGKPPIARYPGHPFFQTVMRMKPGGNRGETRTVAAQISMVYLSHLKHGADDFESISSPAIDEFYYRNIAFDFNAADVERLWRIFDKLDALLGDGKRPRMQLHHAIHVVMLVNALWEDFAPSWEDDLPEAVDWFTASLAYATKQAKESPEPNEFWSRYGQWARTNANSGDTIRRRHEFYMHQMLGRLNPRKKDPKRAFGNNEREIIYFRDQKRCQVCSGQVNWNDAEIHHVQEHHTGGPTELENGALVHSQCHPKGSKAQEFAQKWCVGSVVISNVHC